MQIDFETVRLAARQSNIARYRRILQSPLTEHERRFVERRLAEEEGTLCKQSGARPSPNPAAEKAMSPPACQIVELNVEHFRRLLETERDPVKRETITRLLKEQEQALVRLARQENG